MFRVACVLTSDRNNIYLLFLSTDCSPIQAVLFAPTVLIVSIGKTPLSVALATTNFPAFPSAWFTAFQPPNSVISFTFPASTPVVAPTPSILLIFVLFWIALGNCSSFSFNSSSPAFARGAVYTWFAASSLVVSVVVELGSAARLFRDFGLLLSVVAAVTSAGFAVSTVVLDVSWAFAVVCSLFSAIFASVANFSLILSAAFSAVVGVVGVVVVATGAATSSFLLSCAVVLLSVAAFVTLASVAVLVSAADAAPCPNAINKADTATLAAPKLTLRIEKRVTFSRVEFSILFFNDLFFMIYYLLWLN